MEVELRKTFGIIKSVQTLSNSSIASEIKDKQPDVRSRQNLSAIIEEPMSCENNKDFAKNPKEVERNITCPTKERKESLDKM